MKMGKKLMVFRAPYGINNEYGGILKGGVPPLTGVRRGRSPLSGNEICVFSDPAHALWWEPEAFPLL